MRNFISVIGKIYFKIEKFILLIKDAHIKTRLQKCGIEIKIGRYTIIQNPERLIIGNYTQIADFTVLLSRNGIVIGDNCRISTSCMITSVTHKIPSYNRIVDDFVDPELKNLKIIIGNNVWIGSNCILLPGISVGDNSIVAAGSVVRQNIGMNEIWGGAPAIFISKINFTK